MTIGIVQLLQTVLICMVSPNSLLTLDHVNQWHIYMNPVIHKIFALCCTVWERGFRHATVVALNSITVVRC